MDTTITVVARSTHPQTSHDAAAHMTATKQKQLQRSVRTVVEVFEAHGPLADFELAPLFAEVYGVSSEALHRMARHWARQQGKIMLTSELRTNPLTNTACEVWALGRDEKYFDRPCCPTCGREMGDKESR